jgi:hypothetical protein
VHLDVITLLPEFITVPMGTSIMGRAQIEDIWNSNALLRAYLWDIDNPELIIYRFTPQRVRYMKEWALEYHEEGLGENRTCVF